MMNKRIVVELAGRDSVVALLKVFKDFKDNNESVDFIFNVVYVPSEVDPDPDHNIFALGEILAMHAKRFGHNVIEMLYSAETGVWFDAIKHTFGMSNAISTPCIACHMYCHLCRVKVCKDYDADTILTGERLSHGDTFKVNQFEDVFNLYDSFFGDKFNIKFTRPLIDLDDDYIVSAYNDFCTGYGFSPDQYKFPVCSLSGNIKVSASEAETVKSCIRNTYLDTLVREMTGVYEKYEKEAELAEEAQTK